MKLNVNLENNDVDKIIFTCKEADCSINCKLLMNIPTSKRKITQEKIIETKMPTECPFRIVTPIWKYEGIILVKQKIDENIIHG